MAEAKKVIFVTGTRYSGNTLLSEMLSAQEGVLFAGEVALCRTNNTLTCLSCGRDCPVWRDVVWQRGESIHERAAERSGATTIIDSSKGPVSWIAEQSELLTERGIEWTLVLMTRDPRAVIYDQWKKEPHISVARYAENWRVETGAREKLFRNLAPTGTAIRVRYEELITTPEETLRSICTDIQLPFDERMLYPGKAHQHRIVRKLGVKKLPDDSSPIALRLNDGWKREFDQATTKLIEETAGALFSTHTWNS